MLVHLLVRNQFETSAEKRVSDYSDWFRTGAMYQYALWMSTEMYITNSKLHAGKERTLSRTTEQSAQCSATALAWGLAHQAECQPIAAS